MSTINSDEFLIKFPSESDNFVASATDQDHCDNLVNTADESDTLVNIEKSVGFVNATVENNDLVSTIATIKTITENQKLVMNMFVRETDVKRFAAFLLLRVFEFFEIDDHGLDNFQENEMEEYPGLFGFWSYVTVGNVLTSEGYVYLGNVKDKVFEISDKNINEKDFCALAESYLKAVSRKDMKCSLELYRHCVMLSLIAIICKRLDCETAYSKCLDYIEREVVKAWPYGYVDEHYDACRNFAIDAMDHVFKSLQNVKLRCKYLTRMIVFNPVIEKISFEDIIDSAISENKFKLDTFKEELPKMSQRKFADVYIKFLDTYQRQEPGLKAFIELVVKTMLLTAHSICFGYRDATYQAAEYITSATVLAHRCAII